MALVRMHELLMCGRGDDPDDARHVPASSGMYFLETASPARPRASACQSAWMGRLRPTPDFILYATSTMSN